MEVVNTGSAILDMYLLLIPISIVFDIALALVRNFLMKSIVKHSRFQCGIRGRRHAVVDAVCGCGERVGDSGRGGLFSRQVGCAKGGCRRTLRCLWVVGRHSVCRDDDVEDVEGRWIGRTKSLATAVLRGQR
jgi:hypothetical protein